MPAALENQISLDAVITADALMSVQFSAVDDVDTILEIEQVDPVVVTTTFMSVYKWGTD